MLYLYNRPNVSQNNTGTCGVNNPSITSGTKKKIGRLFSKYKAQHPKQGTQMLLTHSQQFFNPSGEERSSRMSCKRLSNLWKAARSSSKRFLSGGSCSSKATCFALNIQFHLLRRKQIVSFRGLSTFSVDELGVYRVRSPYFRSRGTYIYI